MCDSCENSCRNRPDEKEIEKVINRLRRTELYNETISLFYGCSCLELDEDSTGEREIVRFVYIDDDRPCIEVDINWFKELCYDLNLTNEKFINYIPKEYREKTSETVESIKERHKNIERALVKNFDKEDVDAYHHLVEYLNEVFMHISCDYETEINKFIEKIPFLERKNDNI